jgi:cell wall-associated NlpC family hydrolase
LLAACASNLHRSTATVTDARVPASSGSDDVVFRALGLVGTPYRYGGNTPDGGFDCSGFVSFVYADAAGVALPHNTEELSRVGKAELDPNAVGSGDVVLFSEDDDSVATSHVGIYVGGGRFVHAPKTGGTVRLDDLNQPYWHARFLGARRVLD